MPGTSGPRLGRRPKSQVPIFRTAYAAKAIGALLSFATSLIGSITATPHRAKANIFRRPSILFRPLSPQMMDFGGVAGYRPRVRSAYYMRVYYHSPRRNTLYIAPAYPILKGNRAKMPLILHFHRTAAQRIAIHQGDQQKTNIQQ